MTEPTDALPCPFCGYSGPLDFQDGSTHRWGVAYCAECGASAGETRREYPDVGEWHAKAVAQWNTRTPQPTQAQAGAVPPIEWPKARDVGRIGDMSPSAHMRVGFDSDNDVFVSVWDERGGGSIEFCNPGGGGGGQSSRTRMALIALMVAMEADNAEKPSRDWWALRMGGIKGGQHG